MRDGRNKIIVEESEYESASVECHLVKPDVWIKE